MTINLLIIIALCVTLGWPMLVGLDKLKNNWRR